MYSEYNPFFHFFQREGAEVFLLWAIVYAMVMVYYGRKYIRLICGNGKFPRGRKKYNRHRKNCLMRIVCMIYMFKKQFNINGKYFLFKMYLFENIERINQVYNIATIYTCQLDTTSLYILISVLVLELIYSTWEIFYMKSSVQRDRQVLVDMFVDTFCMAYPLCIMFFRYRIPIDLWEMIRITFVPSYGLLFKSRTLLKDGLKLSKQKQENAIKLKKGKKSSLGRLSVGTMSVQINVMTKGRKIFLSVINLMFLMFYTSVIIAQVVVSKSMFEVEKCKADHANRPLDHQPGS